MLLCSIGNTNILGLGKEPHSFPASFTPHSTLTDTSKRCTKVAQQPTIHPNDATIHRGGKSMCPAHILCPYCGGQTIHRGIGKTDSLLFGLKPLQGNYRTENLFHIRLTGRPQV